MPRGATPIENSAPCFQEYAIGEFFDEQENVSERRETDHCLFDRCAAPTKQQRFAASTEPTVSRKTDSPWRRYPTVTYVAAGLRKNARCASVAFELSRESRVPQDGSPSKTAGCGCHGKVSPGSPA
jgi:hypothetical protein